MLQQVPEVVHRWDPELHVWLCDTWNQSETFISKGESAYFCDIKLSWLMRGLTVSDVFVCFGVCVCEEGVWWEPGGVRRVLGVWFLWEQPQVSHPTLVIFDYHSARYLALNKWVCFIAAIEIDPSTVWSPLPCLHPPAPKFGLSSWDLGHNLCGRVEKSRIGSYPSDLNSNTSRSTLFYSFGGNCACWHFVGRMHFLMTNSTSNFFWTQEGI